MRHYTDITVLLDRSGSMYKIKSDMEGAFDKFVEGHQVNPSTRLTLVQFNSQDHNQVIYEDCPIRQVGKLGLDPLGGTPLIDALAKLIDRTGERFAMKRESERPDQVLFVIITDGEENSSQQYKRSDVLERVRRQTDQYKWQFVYLGANQDALREAKSYGINPNLVLDYMADAKHTGETWRSLTTNTVAYANASGGARGMSADLLNFNEEQRKKSKD